MFFDGTEARRSVDLAHMSFQLNGSGGIAFPVIRGNPILAIEPPANGKLRSRKVVSRSRARGTGKFPSWKMGRMVEWESPYELKVFRIIDADPTILSFSEQPVVISFLMSGEVHRHYPDLAVQRQSGVELWEIKPRKDNVDAETKARTELLSSALAEYGIRYELVGAAEFAQGSTLANAETLLKRGRTPVSAIEREQARRLFSDLLVVRWGDIVGGILGERGCRIICRLALEGVVGFAPESLLGLDTEFHWIGNSVVGRL